MNKLMIKMLNNYKKNISPNCKPRCRYYPTCSTYAIDCYKNYNFFKATALTLSRVLRCNPLSKGGYDPVPQRKTKLIKLTNTLYYLPFEENTDRPNLGYVKGDKFSIMIDAGASFKHVKHFFKELKRNKLPLPKYVLITHHHWDHTFGLDKTNCEVIALDETKEALEKQKDFKFDKLHFNDNFSDDKIPLFCKDHLKLEYKHHLKKLKVPQVKESVKTPYKLDLGNEEVIFDKFISSHSKDTAIIILKKAKVIFLGDALSGKIQGVDFIDDLEIIAKQQEILAKMDFNYALTGHSLIKSKQEILEKLQNKLNKETTSEN